jgi:undecaprenyl diphosphate synthase
MQLFRIYLEREVVRCVSNGVRLSVIGRRDRLPHSVVAAIASAESATRSCGVLHLRLAVDYSSRHEMVRAARICGASGDWSREALSAEIGPDVDLLIRTSGEQRLSDFLLWECAYAEMLFIDRRWPEFSGRDLEDAVAWYRSRDRRYGAVPSTVSAPIVAAR